MARREISLVYASETGTAEDVAQSIAARSLERTACWSFKTVNAVDLLETDIGSPFLIISSTTGDGEFPNNANKALRKWLRTTTAETWNATHYALLGFGSSDYSTFCGAPKTIHRKLSAGGAHQLMPPEYADDATPGGLEETVEAWIPKMFLVFDQFLTTHNTDLPPTTSATTTTTIAPSESVQEQPVSSETKSSSGFELSISDPLLTVKLSSEETTALTAPRLGKLRAKSQIQTVVVTVDDEAQVEPPLPHLPRAWAESKDGQGEFFGASIVSRTVLTGSEALKKTLLLSLKPSHSVPVTPGDAIDVYVPNRPEEVQALCSRLGLEPSTTFTITSVKDAPKHLPLDRPVRLDTLLTHYLDIRATPSKLLLAHCGQNSTIDPNDSAGIKYLCSGSGKPAYEALKYTSKASLLDVLTLLPTANPSLDAVLSFVPKLMPRSYSVASGSADPTVDICFNVVKYKTPPPSSRAMEGLASNWLDALSSDSLPSPEFRISHKPAADFSLPEDVTIPIIMVGPGTGIAPFRAFLQAGHTSRPSWLFFGCRSKDQDFLFKDELTAAESSGLLNKLTVAFSRPEDPVDSMYVQHAMEEQGAELLAWMEKGAFLYVCGDAANMARDVHETLKNILITHGGHDQKAADAQLLTWMKEKRYIRDVWA